MKVPYLNYCGQVTSFKTEYLDFSWAFKGKWILTQARLNFTHLNTFGLAPRCLLRTASQTSATKHFLSSPGVCLWVTVVAVSALMLVHRC